MFRLSRFLKSGQSPERVRTPEQFEQRLEEMRSWVRGPFNSVASWLIQVFVAGGGYIWLKLTNKPKVYFRERMDGVKPPYLFVPNHLTMFDDVFLDSLLFVRFAWRGLKYFPWHAPEEKNFFVGPIFTWMLKRARCVPLTRGHGVFQPGMARLKELLKSENIVQIYPEGTRSRTGDINPGKVGVGRLAYQTGAKFVPCYHEGSQDILPVGRHRFGLGKKLAVIVGNPVDISDLCALPETRETYQKIADRMIQAIRDLRTELHENGWGVKDISKFVTDDSGEEEKATSGE